MAKTRSKYFGKSRSATKISKKRGRKVRSEATCDNPLNQLSEILSLEVSDEEGTKDEDPALRDCFQPLLSPKSSLKAIQRQDEVRDDFVHFIKANNQCNSELKQGVNPPLHILEGFVNRIWRDKVDRVKMFSYGIFLIRFHSIEVRDQILNGGYIFFNRRSIIMKPWDPNTNFKKEDVKCVPIWIQLEDLKLKYWGQKSLFKIVRQLGKPLMVDSVTKERERLNYPRILIEVLMDQHMPDMLEFENEFGSNTSVGIKYEWKPVSCSHRFSVGHSAADCKKNVVTKQQWVVKNDNRKSVQVDEEGFTKVELVGLLKTRVKAPKLGTLYSNVFEGWCFSSNIAWHAGGKIVIAWNPYRFTVDIIKCTNELMHLRVSTTEGFNRLLTILYASNNKRERRTLWKDLCDLSTNEHWCLMGDFNDILAKEERIGHRVRSYPDSDFLTCVNSCHLEDVKASGNYYTWTNKQHEHETQDDKALEHAFIYSVYTLWQHNKSVRDLLDAEDKEEIFPKILALEEVDKAKGASQESGAVNPRTTVPVGENMDGCTLPASEVPISTESAIPKALFEVQMQDVQSLNKSA
uniref:DUF4283 domain-containing protein n=1 Tax=Cannabis sativa TaxID=3483 RepID=A0A803PA00_CANSA